MLQRRQYIRLPARLPITYTILPVKVPPVPAVTRNTGGGGVGFFTETKLEPHIVLRICVTFPGYHRSVTFTGEVVWSGKLFLNKKDDAPHEFETGVRFIDVSPDDRAFIIQFARGEAAPEPPS